MAENTLEQSCSCTTGCCGQGNSHNQKEVIIDFLYLDLEVCTRCQGTESSLDEAIAEVSRVLEAANYKVVVNKIQVTSREQAIALKFVSSPTIRVNGHDIQLNLLESNCESCGDLCGEEVDCREWEYQGKLYTVPPKALIVEAILREVFTGGRTTPAEEEKEYTLPANLEKFFQGGSK